MRKLTWWTCICVALGPLLGGCEEKPAGPRRADHQVAHSARYHPDIQRNVAGSPSSRPTTQPATLPEDAIAAPGPMGSPVLFVNADTITIPDILEPIIDELTRQSKVLSERDYRDSVVRLVRNQIEYQVSGLVVYQEAKNRYSDKKVQEAFDKEVDRQLKERINERYGGIYARYEQHLKSLDFKIADAKERIRREVMVQEFLRERLRPMLQEPPRRELLKTYQARLKEYSTPERAELFLIEIPLSDELGKDPAVARADEIAAARSRIRARLQRALEELESGVDFASVARAYSRGALAPQGGAWGEVSPGTLQKRWAKASEVLFTLKEGQSSGIIETDEAFFIVRCGKRTPAQQQPFEEAQRKVVEHLLDEQFNRLRNKYVKDLLAAATIRKDREFLLAVVTACPRPARAEVGTGSPEPVSR